MKARAYGGEGEEKRRKEKKEERKKRRSRNQGMELYEIVWNFVWNLLGFVWILAWRFRIPLFV